jgi:SAM-dependent methyltransferase
VFVRQVIAEEPGLEPGGYDLILLSEVDHLLPDRARYLARLRAALKPGGRIAVVNRRTYHTALLEAARRAGFSTRDVETLPAHFIVFLEAPA